MQGVYSCPFDYQEFETREELETHIERFHVSYHSKQPYETKPAEKLSPESEETKANQLSEKEILRITNSSHLSAIKSLDISSRSIPKLKSSSVLDLSRLFNLEDLNLSNNKLTNITFVENFPNLSVLNISNNSIDSLNPVQNLVKLTTLLASNNLIQDISALRSCRHLHVIRLEHNQIFNFEHTLGILKSFPKLTCLSIKSNPCVDKVKKSREKLLNSLWLEDLDEESISFEEKKQVVTSEPSSLEVSGVPRKTASELHKVDLKQQTNRTEMEAQVKMLRSENSKLRSELSKVWQLLSMVIKDKNKGNISLEEIRRKGLEEIREEED